MKYLKAVVILFTTMSVLFAIPLISENYPVTEIYYETEYVTDYKTEVYTETENVIVDTISGEDTIKPITKWYSPYMQMRNGYDSVYYFGYRIPETTKHDIMQVRVAIRKQLQPEDTIIRAYDSPGPENGHTPS